MSSGSVISGHRRTVLFTDLCGIHFAQGGIIECVADLHLGIKSLALQGEFLLDLDLGLCTDRLLGKHAEIQKPGLYASQIHSKPWDAPKCKNQGNNGNNHDAVLDKKQEKNRFFFYGRYFFKGKHE